MKLLIAILNYRVTDLTIECLRSLDGRVQRVPGTRVVVCENGTGGDAAGRLRRAIDTNRWGTWVDLVVEETNRGFTGGNNRIIEAALASGDPPEYFLLLNSDTTVLDGALEALLAFMDAHPRAGIAGSQLLSASGEIQASPFRFFNVATEFDRGLRFGPVSSLLSPWAVVPPVPDRATRADWVSGASMMLRRIMLEDVGLLDEGLFTYFDDVDLCLRASRRGWETWYVPESQVIHLEGASSGITASRRKRLPAYLFEARRRFFLKNHGPLVTAFADAAFLAGFTLWRVRRRVQRKPDTDPEHMLGDAFRHSVFRAGFALPVVLSPESNERSQGTEDR